MEGRRFKRHHRADRRELDFDMVDTVLPVRSQVPATGHACWFAGRSFHTAIVLFGDVDVKPAHFLEFSCALLSGFFGLAPQHHHSRAVAGINEKGHPRTPTLTHTTDDGICPMAYGLFVGRYVNLLTFQQKDWAHTVRRRLLQKRQPFMMKINKNKRNYLRTTFDPSTFAAVVESFKK
jgi:hypothetical protein